MSATCELDPRTDTCVSVVLCCVLNRSSGVAFVAVGRGEQLGMGADHMMRSCGSGPITKLPVSFFLYMQSSHACVYVCALGERVDGFGPGLADECLRAWAHNLLTLFFLCLHTQVRLSCHSSPTATFLIERSLAYGKGFVSARTCLGIVLSVAGNSWFAELFSCALSDV